MGLVPPPPLVVTPHPRPVRAPGGSEKGTLTATGAPPPRKEGLGWGGEAAFLYPPSWRPPLEPVRAPGEPEKGTTLFRTPTMQEGREVRETGCPPLLLPRPDPHPRPVRAPGGSEKGSLTFLVTVMQEGSVGRGTVFHPPTPSVGPPQGPVRAPGRS